MRFISFRRPLLTPLLVALLLVALSSASVSAQPFIKGVRVSTTSVDTDGGQLKVNVVVSQFTTGGLGVTSPLGYTGEPDIEWGDGSTTSSAYVNYVYGQYATATDTGNPVYRFRGSFSHTYPDLTPRTIQVNSKCCSNTQTLSTYATAVRRVTTSVRSTRSSSAAPFSRTYTGAPFSSSYYLGFPPAYYSARTILGSSFGTITGDPQTPFISPASSTNVAGSFDTRSSWGSSRGSTYYGYYYSRSSTFLDVFYSAKTRGFTYTLFLDVIFGDGFESGDTNDWS